MSQIKLGKLKLKNPIILASGTAGYGDDNPCAKDVGAIITKGLSLTPRIGNKTPRIWETPSGVMNSIGLENEGVESFIKDKLPKITKGNIPVIINIYGEDVNEYIKVAELLNNQNGILAIEINASCPNVSKGALGFCESPYSLAGLVESVRKVVKLPLIVKLPPRSNLIGLAKSAISAGADIISLVNSFPALVIDTKTKKPVFEKGGGLSGPAIRPIALRMLWDLAKEIDTPIIGGGGIQTADDVKQFLIAGAKAVTIGSSAMVSPFLPKKILKELEL